MVRAARPSTGDAGALRDAAWLRASLAAVWLVTAITVLHPYYREVGADYLGRLGLPAWMMWAADAGELALGIWVLVAPMTRLLAAVQIALVAGFTVILASLEPMLLVSPFGVLTKNVQLVVVAIVAWMLTRDGWSPRAERLLAGGMALVWITEGLFPKILFQQAVELEMAPAAGLTFVPPWLLVGSLGAAQLGSGIAVLVVPRRARVWLLLAQALALVVLPLVAGALEPRLWVHPFGPFSKNLPILAGTFLLYRRCSRSS
ncbi:MAG: DoxX-like family protein [Sandaracinaceae bacterium]|nr:DoxX-like family protein [Sandaracinaceae bacterium]